MRPTFRHSRVGFYNPEKDAQGWGIATRNHSTPKIDIVVRDDIGLEKLARRKTQGVIFSKSKIKKTKNAKKAGQKWSALV